MNIKQSKLTIFIEVLIFIASYFPLFIILLIKDVNPLFYKNKITICGFFNNPETSLPLFLLSLFSLVIITIIMRFALKKDIDSNDIKINIKSSILVRGDMLNYTIPFLVGLIGFSYDNWTTTLSMLVFLTFMFLFLKKDGSLLLNPMLLLLGINLYRITYTETFDVKGKCKTCDVLSYKTNKKETQIKSLGSINLLRI
ncbi:hypothetical protein [Photobacterium phosphoreum]|uniref:hypothetical protein n=1 Tax=Photobacterium phosphoreum TaxID=659 RepID=UPI0039B06E94